MSLRQLLFGRSRALPPTVQEQLARWRALPRVPTDVPLTATSFAVLDVDVTGIDLRTDHLTGIAIAVVENGGIAVDRLWHGRLSEPGPHTLGPADGPATPPADATDGARLACALLEHLGKRPLVTFNAPFVDAMLAQFLAGVGDIDLDAVPRIDLVWVLPALLGVDPDATPSLDNWLAHLGIPQIRKHDALADAWAMAQALLMLLAAAEENDLRTLGDVLKAQSDRRWLRSSRG